MEQETYNQLKAKLNLPDFVDLDAEFEISAVEDGNFPLREIRRKMIEKVETYSTILGEILQPNAESIVNMREFRVFNDEEKKKVYEIYKKLIILRRKSVEADLIIDDKNNADIISEIASQWKTMKTELITIIGKIKDCWEQETTKKERLEYLG